MCFGEYLQAGLRKVFRGIRKEPSSNADQLYASGLALKNGNNGRNMREAFKKFTEAAETGHALARGELAECYLCGRGCERDLQKAAELGNSKAALDLGMKMKREGNECECVRYLWMASDLGDKEAESQLSEVYRSGKMVEKDTDEADRLGMDAHVQFQKFENGLEWGIDQNTKTLFIRGNGRMGYCVPWEERKKSIKFVKILDGVGSISRKAFSGCNNLVKIEIPSTVTAIGFDPFANCDNLRCVNVSERNPKYISEGRRLCYRNGDIFIYSDSKSVSANVHPIKCIFLGISCVGKSSILRRLMGYGLSNETTIGVVFEIYCATFKDKCVKFIIWDTSGNERFHSITFAYTKDAQFVLFVFDLAYRESLFSLESLINKANEVADPNYIGVLLGNKADQTDRQVSAEEVEEFSKKYSLKYVEVSAKTGQNVKEVFNELAEIAWF